MFCQKCGQSIADGVSFCPFCGESTAPSAPTAPVYNNTQYTQPQVPASNEAVYAGPVAPVPKKGKGKLIGIIIAAVAIIAAAVILFIIFFTGADHGSAESVAESFITAQTDGDTAGYLDCMPEFLVEKLCEQAGVDGRGELEETLDAVLQAKLKLVESFKIGEPGIKEKYDREEMIEILEDGGFSESDVKDIKIEGGAAVEIKVTINSKDGESETDTVSVICIKIDSDWYVLHA